MRSDLTNLVNDDVCLCFNFCIHFHFWFAFYFNCTFNFDFDFNLDFHIVSFSIVCPFVLCLASPADFMFILLRDSQSAVCRSARSASPCQAPGTRQASYLSLQHRLELLHSASTPTPLPQVWAQEATRRATQVQESTRRTPPKGGGGRAGASRA